MKPNIFVTRAIPEEVKQYLSMHSECRVWEGDEAITREQFVEAVRDVDGIYTSGLSIDESLLAVCPKLKIVSNSSVGYNNFDAEAMKRHGVIGTNTPDVLNETVADLVFALILSVARRISELDRYMRAGRWKKSDNEVFFGTDVHHATLGIIGMGRIGEAIAKRAVHGFGMKVQYHNRSRKPEIESRYDATYLSLDELLQTSDFVLLMTPLTPETVGMLGEAQFTLMKKSAYFINASRGQTIDEQALIRVLQDGGIAGAALDVYEQEPIQLDNPLLTMENVVNVPHIGSATYKTRFNMAMLAAENLIAGLQGQEPPNRVV